MTRHATGTEAEEKQGFGPQRKSRSWVVRLAGALLALVLLWLAVRDISLPDVLAALRQLSAWQLLLIAVMNAGFYVAIGLRWWVVSRADVSGTNALEMIVVRLSAFSLSYFTPGPQVGGEPLQIVHLHRKGASLARATATVLMDKLMELLTNFLLFVIGATLFIREELAGVLGTLPPAITVAAIAILAWPALHILLLWRGKHPVSAALAFLSRAQGLRRLVRVVTASEHLAGRFCRRRPWALGCATGLSVIAGALVVMEYGLITSFFHMDLALRQMVAAWTIGWMSFLVPSPGGLGALEASQVMALGRFGVQSATAIGAVLVLRARDLLFGGLGLLIAARSVRA